MRSETVMIRLSDDEKAILEEAASSTGLQTASWGRMELLKAARAKSTAVNQH